MGPHQQDAGDSGAVVLNLDPQQLERKVETANNYPELRLEVDAAMSRQADKLMAEFPQMAERAEVLLRGLGPEAYRIEALRPVPQGTVLPPQEETPFYEDYGKVLVERGVYPQAILYQTHLRPVGESLVEALQAP